MIPGEILTVEGDVELNAGRPTITIAVANTGDRPIQVGSHYHFHEVNDALAFDRDAARGYRLDIAAGTAVRFEPGQTRTVTLVALGGERIVYGFAGRVMGPLDAPRRGVRTPTKKAGAAGATRKVAGRSRAGQPRATIPRATKGKTKR